MPTNEDVQRDNPVQAPVQSPADRDAPRKKRARRPGDGFLPIPTNGFDRGFISVVIMVALHLLWMRFLEAHLPLEIATAISIVIGYYVIRYG